MTKFSARRGGAITQRDGSSLQNTNCRMAAIATGLDFHTDGVDTSTGSKMRSHTTDQEGGTASDDAVMAWDRGYGQELRVRDGRTFGDMLDDLRAGREVQLDVWHAAAGGPCLSGSGAYGHTMAVAPDRNDNGQWAVSDPWCKPPKWTWWPESKLRAGAEEWGSRVFSTAGNEHDWPSSPPPGPGLTKRQRQIVARVVRRLMTRYHPANPQPTDVPFPETGGGAILYTTTQALPIDVPEPEPPTPEVLDMAIKPPPSANLLDVPAGTVFFEDANLTKRVGTTSGATQHARYVGLPRGETAEGGSRAVVLRTAAFGEAADWVVYVPHAIGEPYPAPVAEPGDDIAARDAEWLAWLTEGSPGSPPSEDTGGGGIGVLLRRLGRA